MAKAKNGEATQPRFPMEFDLSNPAEAKAWAVAQRKAKTYGVRKKLIVAFLLAVEDFEKATGRDMTTEMVSGFVMARALSGRGGYDEIAPEPPTRIAKDVIIEGSAQKKTAAETAKAMVGGMGNMFG